MRMLPRVARSGFSLSTLSQPRIVQAENNFKQLPISLFLRLESTSESSASVLGALPGPLQQGPQTLTASSNQPSDPLQLTSFRPVHAVARGPLQPASDGDILHQPTLQYSHRSQSPYSTGSKYSDSRDGRFAGRIVQLNGSHAVHLVVAGSSSKDYSLRMVRCHADDDPPPLHAHTAPGQAPEGGADGAAAAGHGHGQRGAVRRSREDVSFPTFIYRQVHHAVSSTFLPAGHPGTTGANYVSFMAWQAANNMALTANSVLASTFMLYAVGLGAGSIPTAGALNWVLKDGMGQLGTLLFGKHIAHNFDVHSKTWFFLSAVMLQAAAALEMATVLVPGHFLAIGSAANMLKGLAWMAAGSTRSVFHLSFAKDSNIADVTAKGTSQYIFASLVGTAGGAVMCAGVGQSMAAAFACCGALAALTLATAYMTVKVIPLATLNATRLQMLVDAFLNSISIDNDHPIDDYGITAADGGRPPRRRPADEEDDDPDDDDGVGGAHGSQQHSHATHGSDIAGGAKAREDGAGGGAARRRRSRRRRAVDRCYVGPSLHDYDSMYDDSLEAWIPTPLQLCTHDPPMPHFSLSARRLKPPILVGTKLEDIVDGNPNLLVMLLTTYKYAHFMVLPTEGGLHVVLHDRADPRDMVQAYLQACILRRRMRRGVALPCAHDQTAELRLELQESLAAAERLTTIFMSTLEAHGWTVHKVVVEAQRRRASW